MSVTSTPVAVAGPALCSVTVNVTGVSALGPVCVGTALFVSDRSAIPSVVVVVEVLVLVDELVEVVVEVQVVVVVVVEVVVVDVVVVDVVAVVQSWKQQEQDVETTPPICVQAAAVFAVAHCGGFANWQVTPPVPHDVAASQLCSSDLHADVIVRVLWETQLWKLPRLLPVQSSPLQHCDWLVL